MTSLASALTETLYWMSYGTHPDWRQRAFTIISGTTSTGIASICFSLLMLIGLFTYEESQHNFDLYSIVYEACFMGSCFVPFWTLNRLELQQIFVDLQAIFHRMERDFPGHEAMGQEYVPAIRMISKLFWYSFAVQAAGLALLPLSESACPPSIRGTWITLALRIIQSVTFITMCTGAVQFFVGQIAFILYFRGGLFLLADFFQTADDITITKIVRNHAELLRVSVRRNKVFSAWNGIIFAYVFSLAVHTTVIVIRGVFIPTVNAILPLTVSCTLMMCAIGHVLENACERFAEAANFSTWYTANKSYKTVLMNVILRCQRPEILHAKIFGAISYPFFIRFIKNYYRFVQAMLNVNRG